MAFLIKSKASICYSSATSFLGIRPGKTFAHVYLETYAIAYNVEHYITVKVTEIQSHAAA